jgi:hypothetical protein
MISGGAGTIEQVVIFRGLLPFSRPLEDKKKGKREIA